jgi:hypothetical protein
MDTNTRRMIELETLAKAANAAPLETLRKCNEMIETLVQERIAEGHTELQARRHVLSDGHPLGSRLYALSCDLGAQLAFNDTAFLG